MGALPSGPSHLVKDPPLVMVFQNTNLEGNTDTWTIAMVLQTCKLVCIERKLKQSLFAYV